MYSRLAKPVTLLFFLAMLRPAHAGQSDPAVRKKVSVFRFEEPRWQVGMLSNFARFLDYENLERRGRGASLFSLFRITRALSISTEVGWFFLGRAGGAPEGYEEEESTQAARLKGLVRYDLDIIDLHPYFALGGSIFVFTAGNLVGFDPVHWGPDVEIGLDWTIMGRILFGVALDWGWILKYRPPEGRDYPTFTQVAVKMGSVF